MDKFDDATLVEFLRRSYFTVDGLWFVKTEEKRSFEEALELDEQVWTVMPKIQARKAKQLLGLEGNSLRDLAACFGLKFAAEGFDYEVRWPSEDALEIVVRRCPWYAMLSHAGREAIANSISEKICTAEFEGWTNEFAGEISFKLEKRLCAGDGTCVIRFKEELRKTSETE